MLSLSDGREALYTTSFSKNHDHSSRATLMFPFICSTRKPDSRAVRVTLAKEVSRARLTLFRKNV